MGNNKQKEIYLDNAATTKPCIEAISAINECLLNEYGNPSSLHRMGLDAQLKIEKARRAIAKELGCDFSEIYFTSCATESTNLALKGTVKRYGKKNKNIVVSSVEHSSVKAVMKYLETQGYNITYISPRDDGCFYAEDFINAVDDQTLLVSMMLVNNENGYILPVDKVFKTIKRKYPSVICHTDVVQGFMKINFKIKDLNCDLLSVSGHKIYASKGIGAIYINKKISLPAEMLGGGQEKNMRSGTESVPLISGFGAAIKFISENRAEFTKHFKELHDYIIQKAIETDGIEVNSVVLNGDLKDPSSYEKFVPYIVNISAPGIRSEILLHYLEQKNIFVSSGSACSKGKSSGVLEEFGITKDRTDSALRISTSYETTTEDIDRLFEALDNGLNNIQKIK